MYEISKKSKAILIKKFRFFSSDDSSDTNKLKRYKITIQELKERNNTLKIKIDFLSHKLISVGELFKDLSDEAYNLFLKATEENDQYSKSNINKDNVKKLDSELNPKGLQVYTKKKKQRWTKSEKCGRSKQILLEFINENDQKVRKAVEHIDKAFIKINNIQYSGYREFEILNVYQIYAIRAMKIGLIILNLEIDFGKYTTAQMDKICKYVKVYPDGILNFSRLKYLTTDKLKEALQIATFYRTLPMGVQDSVDYRFELNGFILNPLSKEKFSFILTVSHLLVLSEVKNLEDVHELMLYMIDKKPTVKKLIMEIKKRNL